MSSSDKDNNKYIVLPENVKSEKTDLYKLFETQSLQIKFKQIILDRQSYGWTLKQLISKSKKDYLTFEETIKTNLKIHKESSYCDIFNISLETLIPLKRATYVNIKKEKK